MNVLFKIAFALSAVSLPSFSVNASATCEEHQALFERAQDLFIHRQFLLSALHFSELSVSKCNPALASKAQFSYALALSELGERTEALRQLTLLKSENALLLKAFLAPEFSDGLMPSSRFRLQTWGEKNNLEQLSNLSLSPYFSEKQKIDLKEIHSDLLKLPTKNPVFAGIASSILPGAGQAYAGAYQSAALAFVINALFLATTIEFANQKLPAAAIASGTLFSITYIGNILNAAESASRKNNNARLPEDLRLKRTLFPEFTP